MQFPKTIALLLASATIASLGARVAAQDSSPQATDEFPPIVPVPWNGAELDNAWVDALPLVATRGAEELGDKALAQWQDMLLKKFDEFVKPVDGSSNPREAAYTMLNVFIGASLAGAAGTTLAGAGGGVLLGGIITSESGGWGAAPGLALGGGAGLAVGAVEIGGTVLASMVIADEIERRYPYENGGVRARDLGDASGAIQLDIDDEVWIDPPEWIVEDSAEAVDASAGAESTAGAAAEATGDDVAERGLDGRTARATGRQRRSGRSRTSRRPRYAGAQESLFIHVIGELVAPKVRDLVRHWDRMPGLSRSQRARLSKLENPLRGLARRIDYVRTNHKLSRNAPPAMPLSSWQRSALRTLSGTANAGVWLDAFAIGNTKISINGSTATWRTPRTLRSFGARSSYSTKIAPLYARVRGFGGELSGKITPGKFDIEIGSMRVDGNRLRIGVRVRSGKRLATVSVKAKLAGQTRTLMSFKPRLSSHLRADVFFRIAGTGLTVDSVKVAGLKLNLGIKRITHPMFAPLEGLRRQLEGKIRSQLAKMLGKSFGWNKLFGGVKNAAPKKLLDILNKSCDELGVAQVKSLRGLRARNGKLELQVEALTWNGAPRIDHRRYGGHVRRVFR